MTRKKTPIKSVQIDTKRDIKKNRLVELWRETRGHISDMCKSAGVSRVTFYKWLKEDKIFNQAIQDAESELNDDVEKSLIHCIASGKESSIHFYLKKRHPKYKDKKGTTIISDKTLIAPAGWIRGEK